MNILPYFGMAVLFAAIADVNAQTVLLFQNDFSAPNQPPAPNCAPDLDQTSVNTLWGATGTGTGGGGLWAQINTVETILITGPNGQYTDTAGIGGDYCISMLSTFQDDRAALTLDAQTLPFVNVYFDVSAIDLNGCGGPFGLSTPSYRLTVYDSPGGVFDIFSPGNVLDEDTVFGSGPGDTPFTFAWSSVASGLDVSASSDGNITVMFDLLTSGYAALDNIVIEASVEQVGITDRQRTKDLRIWPVPTTDLLFTRPLEQDASWSIIDASGSAIMRGNAPWNGGLDVSALAPGLYTMIVLKANEHYVSRFIKQ